MESKGVPEVYRDPRLASEKAFFRWAKQRWSSYTSRFPLALRPVRRGYAEVQDHRGRPVDLYVGLYPLEG